jgi:hypothetical protein
MIDVQHGTNLVIYIPSSYQCRVLRQARPEVHFKLPGLKMDVRIPFFNMAHTVYTL